LVNKSIEDLYYPKGVYLVLKDQSKEMIQHLTDIRQSTQ